MGARVMAWMARIDALSLRERAILLMVSLLVLFMLADQLFISPSLKTLRQERVQIADLQSKLSALEVRTAQLGSEQNDPLQNRKTRIAELEAQLSAQGARFEEQLGRLVHPQQAAQLLRDILRKEPGLRLLNLDSAPGEALLGRDETNARIVRYNLELRVEGGYLAVLDYLKRLEALPWTFIWSDFDLHVSQHPTSVAQLTVYTLGQRL